LVGVGLARLLRPHGGRGSNQQSANKILPVHPNLHLDFSHQVCNVWASDAGEKALLIQPGSKQTVTLEALHTANFGGLTKHQFTYFKVTVPDPEWRYAAREISFNRRLSWHESTKITFPAKKEGAFSRKTILRPLSTTNGGLPPV
jgi:hypothetical protein